jgi:O-antigen/teichoic acid export membrane protein
VVIFFIIFTEPFIAWYVGPDFSAAVWTAKVYVFYWFLNSNTGAIGSSIVGTGRINFLVVYNLLLLITKIILSFLLISRYGHLGAASATTLAYIVFTPIFLYWGLRVLGIPVGDYLSKVFVRHILPLAITVIFALGMFHYLNKPMLIHLAPAAVSIFVIYQASFYFLALKKSERLFLKNYLLSIVRVGKGRKIDI